ncbi:hypothetical protein [Burkholderia mayonis]|uniref:DnaT DNA-binding domain-containing protein n=1 Tax=Burkholderia mayonis TaxID=1385591 RepID=A0A1B4G352_9BURK|nr:hypothetical protein [Burkholderia mayonis]AOJ10357.1 hypothetical protein WS71_24415 [Burkholderia mayonis]KVE53661.1 hypothetical protein WS71_06355 [Burkholderia mayonis]
MARIRTIKPDFWTDEKIVELSFEARLFFIGSWNFADDNGNLQRSAKKLKMQIFPADAIDCEPIIQSLLTHGLLSEYEVNGEKYLHIKGFSDHQVINRPSKTGLPTPESGSTPTPLTESSLTEGKGREGKGKDKTVGTTVVIGTPSRATDQAPTDDDLVPCDSAAWCRYFAERHGVEIDHTSVHQRAKAFPLFAAWTKAGITRRRMDEAVAKAQAEATESIAFLPAYVDRILASMAAPRASPTANARDERRRAGWAELTGSTSRQQPDAQPAEVIDGHAKLIV